VQVGNDIVLVEPGDIASPLARCQFVPLVTCGNKNHITGVKVEYRK
jgi:hypothetical protein